MALYDPVQQDEEDVARYGNDYGPAVSAPVVAPPSVAGPAVVPPGRLGDQYSQMQASDAEIGAATDQLNAGQPVTALPRQAWSPAQAQSFAARLDAFDQQAKAARIASDQAAMDAQMLDQMSRVAHSAKDIEIARRNIDVMGLQRDIQNGVPIHEAIARRPNALGGGFGAAYKATAPAAQLPNAEVKVLPDGTRLIQVSPEKWQVLDKGPTSAKEGALTPVQTQRLREIDRQAHDLRVNMPVRETSDEYINAQNELRLLTLKRNKILSEAEGVKPKAVVVAPPAVAANAVPVKLAPPSGVTGTIHPMPTTKSGLVEGNIYDTPRGAAQWDGNKFKIVQTR